MLIRKKHLLLNTSTLGSILSQQGDDGKLHLVTFYSRKFDIVEINYEVYNELLAIVDSFAQWLNNFWKALLIK